jgi:two-component system chemotaxis response regulator CheY
MPKTALIVDDSTSIRQMVAFTLKEAGFSVLEGANGKEGLEQLERHPVDLIITDLNMPVMDGLTFIRQTRSRTATRFTPILMLTTEGRAEAKQAGRAAGATGWIVKPFQPERLVSVVGQVLP